VLVHNIGHHDVFFGSEVVESAQKYVDIVIEGQRGSNLVLVGEKKHQPLSQSPVIENGEFEFFEVPRFESIFCEYFNEFHNFVRGRKTNEFCVKFLADYFVVETVLDDFVEGEDPQIDYLALFYDSTLYEHLVERLLDLQLRGASEGFSSILGSMSRSCLHFPCEF
jgi:hypothetical protein